MLDQLRQIAVFAKTVEHGSFRKAAVELRLSPSVVSHHVYRLEQKLGVALLYRSTRKLSLTSDGEKLLASANAMMRAAHDFFDTASSEASRLNGEIRIALPAAMEHSSLVSDLGKFASMHRGVVLQLDFSDSVRDLIRDGVDLAIRMGVDGLRDSNLRARKLNQVARHVVASEDYLRARPRPTSPKDLEAWDWIELTPVGTRLGFRHRNGSRVSIRPTSQIRVSNVNAVVPFIQNGNGLAAMPDYLVAADLATGKLRPVLTQWAIQPIQVYAVWPGNAPQTGLTRQVVQYLVSPATP